MRRLGIGRAIGRGGAAMRIALCDDVKEYNKLLHGMLKNYVERNQIENCYIKEYLSGINLLKDFALGSYDIIFLDVDMPGLDGFEAASHIRKIDRRANIIFVTNMADQVHASFKFGAKDYLCKPINQLKIDELMDRLMEERSYEEKESYYSIDLKFGGSIKLYLPDVVYFESDNKYVVAVTKDKIFTLAATLGEVAVDLERKGFVRIHRRRIVNKIYVFAAFGNHLALKTGEEFDIGRTYKGIVNSIFERLW